MESTRITRIAYLITRSFSDILSADERVELERWLSEDRQHRLFAESVHRRNFFSDKKNEEHLYDSLAAFQKVQARRHRYFFRKRMLRIGGSVAATVALVMGMIVLKWYGPIQEKSPQAQEVQLGAGESRALLILTDGRKKELTPQLVGSVVAGEGMKMDTGGIGVVYPQRWATDTAIRYNTLVVPRKGEFRLVLSDGTKVWLNSGSRIEYPVAFGKKERRVYMEGEAYFEVSANKESPFIVDLGKASVRVLGTSFNARAYKEEGNIYATLSEGRIQLVAGEKSLILQPEEQGVVQASGNVFRKKVDVNLYCAWKDGRFVFQEQTMEEIMNTLERWYDIEVFFESSGARKVTFSGNLKRYDTFNQIIELLEMTGMVHFKVSGNSVFISE